MTEFGIEWRHGDGRTHIGGEYTLEAARRMLAGAGDGKKWDPHAARVVVRDVSDWRDVESPCVAGDSAPRKAAAAGKIEGAPRQGLDDPAATACKTPSRSSDRKECQ